MELQEDRIINGLLKADIGFLAPEAVRERLSQDVVISVDPKRAVSDDLWPCIWLLAAALERQFTGAILIDAGLASPLPAPIPLSSRCRYVSGANAGIRICVGTLAAGGSESTICGDTRGNAISFGSLVHSAVKASPITCCALAGYLGFAALAQAVGIPPFHQSWSRRQLQMPFEGAAASLPPNFAVLGTEQLGQAFLALSFFLNRTGPCVHLVDKDEFESANGRTQILLGENVSAWDGKPKAEYLRDICRGWGWSVSFERTEIEWGWKQPNSGQWLGFVGFDNMDARRVAAEGGFDWLFECGVGSNFCAPRVSWHSLPPDRQMAKRIFESAEKRSQASRFAQTLQRMPGDCGVVRFENIQATAPSLGLTAAAYAIAEAVNYLKGETRPYAGSAYLWSPLLPFERNALTMPLSSMEAA